MKDTKDQRKELRADLTTEVEFTIDSDQISAHTIDVSNSGLRLETQRPIRINLRFTEDVSPANYFAELVWAKRADEGFMEYGFRYIEKHEEDE